MNVQAASLVGSAILFDQCDIRTWADAYVPSTLKSN
jgi:hypothetical protein